MSHGKGAGKIIESDERNADTRLIIPHPASPSTSLSLILLLLVVSTAGILHDSLCDSAMIQSARNWFKRNRTTFAIGAGVLGAGYLATQYALNKLTESRQRMSDERIAKDK